MEKPILVLLAGGNGTSFYPFTIHKTLFPFFGKTLLQHTLELAHQQGFTELFITTNDYNHAWVEESKAYFPSLSITAKKQPEATGMADALLLFEAEIGSRPIIVKSAADITDASLYQELLASATRQDYAALTVRTVTTYFPGGYVSVEGDRAIELVEKPGAGNEPSNQVILTGHYFSQPQEFFALIHEYKKQAYSDTLYEEALNALMKIHVIRVVPYTAGWAKLKYGFNVLDMTEYFLRNRITPSISAKAVISPHAVVEGAVQIEEGAVIHDFAVVKGPAYIGRGVVVCQHALVRESILEANCVVGFGSEVARSYLGEGTKLHHNYIGDSVLEPGVRLGYGACTANVRADKQNVDVVIAGKRIPTQRRKVGAFIAQKAFIGVNASLMPGVLIETNSTIMPGSVVFTSKKE
ncbi:NTP transferase domain-containing protein [Candidatus Roizmanbacteria bacterium]|nr:NTP transferase domain-containing protein [Candidatus Roizmanbacteria bacterium]